MQREVRAALQDGDMEMETKGSVHHHRRSEMKI